MFNTRDAGESLIVKMSTHARERLTDPSTCWSSVDGKTSVCTSSPTVAEVDI